MASGRGSRLLLLLMVPLLMLKTVASGKPCRAPPPEYPTLQLKKSNRSRSSYFSGERVFYNCALGHTSAAGSLFVRCEDGLWTQLSLRCERGPPEINCPSLSVDNGMMISGNTHSYEPTHTVRFACREGFDLNGPKEITCGPDGQWDQKPPQCQPPANGESCGPPASYLNMYRVDEHLAQQLFPPKSHVTYKCTIGYVRTRGTRHVSQCTNGLWTPIDLKCERKSCGSAGEILHGHYNYQGVQFGDRVTAVCDEGYELIGRPYRQCLEMGWDGRDAVCEAVRCDDPPSVANADWSGPRDGAFLYRTVVTYQCLQGQLIGKSEIYCTNNGTWSPNAPQCRDVTCLNPTVRNADKTSGFRLIYTYGDSVTFRCRKGHVLDGAGSVTCQADGRWMPTLPKCKPVGGKVKKCPEIKVVNGTPSSRRLAAGQTVRIKCNTGFRLQGAPTVTCLPSGSWNATLPTCIYKWRH